MARLIWLNGPPGVGKSTIARRYADDRPLTLVLDVDAVRDLLGSWVDQPTDAGPAARALALAMARTHLEAGHDVVVPQSLARPEFAQALRTVADATNSRFVEIVLDVDVDTGARRFSVREAVSRTRWQAEPYDRFYDRIAAFTGGRPDAVRVDARDGDIDGTYARVVAAIG